MMKNYSSCMSCLVPTVAVAVEGAHRSEADHSTLQPQHARRGFHVRDVGFAPVVDRYQTLTPIMPHELIWQPQAFG